MQYSYIANRSLPPASVAQARLPGQVTSRRTMVRVLWFALGATCFCAYVLTMYPTISGGDSGELMTVACNFGVAHPPGYPLWTWLAAALVRAAPIAPGTTPAWRVGLLSAACDSCAAVIIAAMTRIILGSGVVATACAVLAAGCFAFSPNVWRYAGQAEVFGLNNLLVALFLYGLARFNALPTAKVAVHNASAERQRWAHMTALCCGLALTNQHTGVLYVLPVAAWVAGRLLWLHELSPGRALSLIVCGVLGMLPYVHLPIVANRRVQDAWGDQSTWDGFLTHFLRREYGTFVLASLHELGQKQGTLEAMAKDVPLRPFSEPSRSAANKTSSKVTRRRLCGRDFSIGSLDFLSPPRRKTFS